ncbi:MAG TPA: Flp family type IVb pilin [Nocardioidaceae bacterium]|nr:Flp family type IVb pilin [Nocardioidaceae bacterium]
MLRPARDQAGASAVEYGLIVVAIAAVIAIVVFALGGLVQQLFGSSCTTMHSKISASTSCTP